MSLVMWKNVRKKKDAEMGTETWIHLKNHFELKYMSNVIDYLGIEL